MTSTDAPPHESEAPSARFDGEDFLYHLYRGSELLQDNCVEQAKEELERALRMQPRDVEGQGLLGVVYFRLGLYPRAIEIYRDIVRECPDEVTPKLNLALCYFKTGQPAEARDLLEDVLRKVPDHPRAWGYLGLVFERLGEYKRAGEAFERAGQPHLARRMQQLLNDLASVAGEDEPREELRRAAADAVEELEAADEVPFSRAEPASASGAAVGRWKSVEPGEDPLPPLERRSRPPLVGRLGPVVPAVPEPTEMGEPSAGSASVSVVPAVRAPVSPEELVSSRRVPDLARGAGKTADGLVFVHVQESFAVRTDRLRALSPAGSGFSPTALKRRVRGRETDEPFGVSGSSWALLSGAGLVLLEPSRDRELVLLQLSGEFVYVRESRVVGFDGLVRYENGRLPAADPGPVPMVQFAGRGVLVFESHSTMRALGVSSERPVTVRAASVLGWTGRLLGQAVPASEAPSLGTGFVAFNGDGSVLVDDP